MIDNEFDNFVNGKLSNHQAPVPDGLWDKLTDKQFDDFIGNKLKDNAAPVPEGLWDKVADGQFDNFFGNTLSNYTAPVPDGLWGKISDQQFDGFFADKLNDHTAPLPEAAWGNIADKQFDGFFADTLSNYTATVPAGLWEKIQPEEKEDRKILYWLRLPMAASFIIAILLGGTFAAYLWFRPQANTAKTIVIKQTSKTIGPNTAKEPAATKDSAAPGNTIVPVIPDANTQQGANTTETVKPNTENEAGIHLKKEPTGNDISVITGRSGNSLSNTPATDTKTNGQKIRNSHTNKRNNLLQSPSANDGELMTKSATPTIGSLPDSATDFAENIAPYTSNLLTAVTIPSAPPIITGWKQSDLTSTELTNSKHASQFKSNVICPTNRSHSNTDWLLEVYASPDIAFKSVMNNSATQQYLLRKDSIEHMQVGFSGGIRLVKPLNDNFWVKTGLQYSQINQNYVYRSENEIKTTTVITQRTIIVSPGDTVHISDTSSLQQIGYKNLTVKNRFRSIDVPVLLGYRFGEGDLKFAINAGVIFNVSSWYQGSILDTSLAVVPLTKSNDMIYKSHIGLGLYAGFSITKQLSDDMDLFFEPYFRYNLSNMTSAQSSYSQKFSIGGLSIGLRFNLNK
jgi:hypothetical protein